ncbi:MAG: T9SS type A sorting domain-containing protein [Flavobacteriales bacterium]
MNVSLLRSFLRLVPLFVLAIGYPFSGALASGDVTLAPPPPCTTDVSLDITLPTFILNGPTYELRDAATNMVVASGGGGPMNGGTPNQFLACLPDGNFYLIVDGMPAGAKYLLRLGDPPFTRIIDNIVAAAGTSQVTEFNVASPAPSTNGAVQLPIGPTELLYTSCDKYYWKKGEFIVVNEDPDVAAEWISGGGNSAQSSTTGYDFWFYDPNGTYSFMRQRRHNVSDGFGNVGSARTCHMQVNNWPAASWIPDQLPLNVRVRAVVNNVPKPWGPACRFARNDQLGSCPPTLLMDVPGNPFFSCNVFRHFATGSSNRIYARPVSGATKYRFTMSNGEGSIVREVFTYYLPLGWNPGVAPVLEPGSSYDVTVEAFKGGVYCPVGESCIVNIYNQAAVGQQNSATEAGSEGGLSLWPNPNRGGPMHVQMPVPKDQRTVSVEIRDLTGKVVGAQVLYANEGRVDGDVAVDAGIANGIYVMRINARDHSRAERFVIQR